MKKCSGYKTISFHDPYFPGETYNEQIDCYCDECVSALDAALSKQSTKRGV